MERETRTLAPAERESSQREGVTLGTLAQELNKAEPGGTRHLQPDAHHPGQGYMHTIDLEQAKIDFVLAASDWPSFASGVSTHAYNHTYFVTSGSDTQQDLYPKVGSINP
ncbi:hypothetical protein PCASD_18617 [Puccinia coronata f. sp. avenae]|uniref:Uncharacterized protein n=1 Tax=Puccinia coronata f. sp. avenae TaxID=200324 RepID=A0A2N5TAA9_9BASI|nr:hypothetical protein PCASD_18617 [Puccinia coronata f. sp. avenae]